MNDDTPSPASDRPLLFDPLRLRGSRLPNRIVVSPMCMYSATDGTASPWHHVHLGSLACSGAGLVLAEATSVEARGRITPNCLGLWSDENERALADVVATVKSVAPRSVLGIQLAHAGRKASHARPWAAAALCYRSLQASAACPPHTHTQHGSAHTVFLLYARARAWCP